MIVTCVHVEVRPEYVHDFIAECFKNHSGSVNEPGNLRFDVLQDHENPNKFMFYEAYQSEEEAAAHKQTHHYNIWRNSVEKMMAKPRHGIKYHIVCPLETDKW
jgi:(4S)-4-hydroxy-5-phosphonooxypentane-2,3-dione isomerase